MKKIWGAILKVIQHLITRPYLSVDKKAMDLLKATNPQLPIYERIDDLLKPGIPEMPGPGQVWENTLGTVIVHPELCFMPSSLEALQDIVGKAELGGHKIRAIGSGHSFSDVAPSTDYLVFTHDLNRSLPIDKNNLTEQARSLNLFEVEAGIRLHDLNLLLDSQKLALTTMGSFDAQTIIGAISTGTHGTGFSAGSMPGMVRSIVLVSAGGNVSRIEPLNGITDSSKPGQPGISLIQDNDLFYSVLVGLGCMGLIYSLVLEVTNTFWLDEQRSFTNWHLVRPKLEDGAVIRENQHYEVQVNPYGTIGTHTCLVTTQNPISEPSGTVPAPHGHRNYIAAFLDLVPEAPEVIRLYLDTFPKIIPKTIDSALKSLRETSDYFNKSFQILYEGLPNFKKIGYASEFAFPLAGNKYLDAVEKIFEVAAAQQKSANKYIDSPISLRFVKSSPAYLSLDYDMDTCLLDIPTLFASRYSDQMLDILQDAMLALGGRPHWGKINNRQPEIVKNFYPKFPQWKQARSRLDPKNIFSNDFTDRFGL
jgi:FAD/FMN-containing dehydrogenase